MAVEARKTYPLAGKRFLVVDDDPTDLYLLRQNIQEAALVEVAVTCSAAMALSLLASGDRPDIVISDV